MSDNKLNINSTVKVKLNERGIIELKRQRQELIDSWPRIKLGEYKPNIDEDGYTRFQLHDLMNRLGHMCTLRFEPPFETDILIEDEL